MIHSKNNTAILVSLICGLVICSFMLMTSCYNSMENIQQQNESETVIEVTEKDSYEEQNMVEAANQIVSDAMMTQSVHKWSEEDVLNYFRMEIDDEGRLLSKVIDFRVQSFSLDGDTGNVSLLVTRVNYFDDGTTRKMLDYPSLSMEKMGDEWVVSDIYIPT